MAVLVASLTLSHLSSSIFNQRQNGLSFSSGLLCKAKAYPEKAKAYPEKAKAYPEKAKAYPEKANFRSSHRRNLRVKAATGGSAKNRNKSSKKADDNSEDASVPLWAQKGSDELPPWARQEVQEESSSSEVPFYVYLIASAITAIAAVGSVFEYVNQKPVFGVLNYDSVFYAPLLGFFAFTGIPSSAFLWFKSVQVANKEAEEQDRKDGYL